MFDATAKNTIAPLILRMALAVIFLYHGQQLIVPEQTRYGSNWMPKENAQHPAVQLAVAWGQLIGGCAMALGFLTRLAALGLIAIMVGAIQLVHWPNGFDIRKGGWEYNFAIIAIALALVFTGGGTLSMDRVFYLRRRRARA